MYHDIVLELFVAMLLMIIVRFKWLDLCYQQNLNSIFAIQLMLL